MESAGSLAYKRPLVFIHLPRTGGTTLTRIVERQFPPAWTFAFDDTNMDRSLARYYALPKHRRQSLRLLRGHIPFGIHEVIGPVDYVTMLRDPIERVISCYEYIPTLQTNALRARAGLPSLRRPVIRGSGHPLRPFLRGRIVNVDLREYVESGIYPEARNGQCRLLSGQAYDGATSNGEVDLLERAWRNLTESFVAVGLTERFDESLLLYRELLGWERLSYSRANVLAGRPAAETFPDDVLEVVRQHNTLDLELYARARARFEEALATLPDRSRELKELRRSNTRRKRWWGLHGGLSDLRWDVRRRIYRSRQPERRR